MNTITASGAQSLKRLSFWLSVIPPPFRRTYYVGLQMSATAAAGSSNGCRRGSRGYAQCEPVAPKCKPL